MEANIIFNLFLIVMGGAVFIWLIAGFDRVNERWRYAISVLFAILGFILSAERVENNIQVAIDARTKKTVKEFNELREEVLGERVLGLIVQNRDSLDSLLLKVARLDTCVDKHFAYLHRRLDKLELEK